MKNKRERETDKTLISIKSVRMFQVRNQGFSSGSIAGRLSWSNRPSGLIIGFGYNLYKEPLFVGKGRGLKALIFYFQVRYLSIDQLFFKVLSLRFSKTIKLGCLSIIPVIKVKHNVAVTTNHNVYCISYSTYDTLVKDKSL